MGRYLVIAVSCAAVALALALSAEAGIPRGLSLMADDQDADPATGVTIARGNAEIKIENQPINGHADEIEVNPVRNDIQFKGRAFLLVGHVRYEGVAITCALDFSKCAVAPNSAGATLPNGASPVQALPPPAALGAAVINPQ